MTKQLIILVFQVKYPSSSNSYLTANSYLVENGSLEELEKAATEFRNDVEKDGFKIINNLIYIVPQEQIKLTVEWLYKYKSAADEALSTMNEIETSDPSLKRIKDLALRALNIGAHGE